MKMHEHASFVGHVGHVGSCPRETHGFPFVASLLEVSGMPILRDFDAHERNVDGANGLCENHFP